MVAVVGAPKPARPGGRAPLTGPLRLALGLLLGLLLRPRAAATAQLFSWPGQRKAPRPPGAPAGPGLPARPAPAPAPAPAPVGAKAGTPVPHEATRVRKEGEFLGPAWNVARGKPASMSSHRGHRRPELAVDGDTLAFYEASGAAHGYAESRVSENPWLLVDLGREHELRDIDVWAPQLHCKTALIKVNKKTTPRNRPGACKRHHTMVVDRKQPLVVEVLDAAQRRVAHW